MISVTPSARKPASSRVLLLLAGALVVAGCARDPIDEAAWQASRVGTAYGDHPDRVQISGIEAGSRVAERYYVVAKYQATLEQRQIAETAGRKAQARLRARASRPVQPASGGRAGQLPPIAQYIAVSVSPKGPKKGPPKVMVWDTQAQEIVGNSVYDINSTPPVGASVKFETFAAEYVGTGN